MSGEMMGREIKRAEMIGEERFDKIVSSFDSIAPILVVGDVGIDKYTFGAVTRISPEAPVPVVEVKKEWFKLGLAANVSDNLQGLEVASTLCGVTGSDRNGELFDNLLEERQLKTWGIVREDIRPTTYKERITTNVQQVCRVDYETKECISPESERKVIDRALDFMGTHSAVILEDYGKGLLTEKLAHELIQTAREQGKWIAVDPSEKTPPRFYRKANLLKPNRKEAMALASNLGHRSITLAETAKVLLNELELDSIIITLGPEGMALMNREDETLMAIPTVASEVFDVSGAGDTAVSAIISSLVCGADLEEAAWIGNFASGVVVGKKGTAQVSRSELREFFRRAKNKL
ncbi:MAG: PfkB family carbohydrate kinase [Bacteriovoracales bacterium]|nr:PfkB family carbohydrate kinase [Bacteriovoracales bacterium]